jgi:hypothetical protein
MKIATLGATAVAIMLCAAADSAAGEVLVIGSDFDGYELGARLADDPELDIPRCRTLVLLKEQNFIELPGPYKGVLSAYRNANIHCGQLTFEERQNWYDYYFRTVCAKEQRCDDECKAVFEKVEDKKKLSFQCD